MGLLDDYNVDLDEFEANSFDVPDGVYDFAIGEVATQEGSKNNPDQPMIYIHYILTSEGDKNYTNREYFWIPIDPTNPTDQEKKAMGRLKSRIMSLGFEEDEANSVGPEDLVGLTGSFQLVSSKGKNDVVYQNIRNIRVDDEEEIAPVIQAPKPARRTTTRPAAVDKPVSKPASKPRATRPPSKPAEPEEPVFEEPPVDLPENQPEQSDADIKAKIEARRAARRAAAGAR